MPVCGAFELNFMPIIHNTDNIRKGTKMEKKRNLFSENGVTLAAH